MTDKQIAANHQNSKSSTGPRTPAGKNRSRLNATRHGLTGQVTIMTEEDRLASEAFIAPMIASFHPATPYETQLAQAIATCHWRINRAAALEENILTLSLTGDNLLSDTRQVAAAFAQAAAFLNNPQALDRLSLYTHRLTNQAAKHLKELTQLQADRKTQEAAAMTEAVMLYKYHEMSSLPFDPTASGFVLSLAEIRLHLQRQKLRDRAYNATHSSSPIFKTAGKGGNRAA